MKKYDYVIVGCGLFGSVCAYELNKAHKKVLIIDKRNHIGGNIYTKNIEGIDVHVYGAHIFHTSNKMIWDYINQFGEFNNYINSPCARYKDKIYNLPFNMNTFCKLWSDVFTPEDAKKKIENEVKNCFTKDPKNLKEQALNLVGPTIYHTLIEGYTAKQWGKSCEELPPFIIKRIPVRFTFDNNYFNDCYQGIPKCGYTKIIEKMIEGIDIKLNYDFFTHKNEILQLTDKIIFTGQIDEYFNYSLGNLEYRKVHFENEILDCCNYQGNAVINYTERDIPYTRIIEHKHFMFDTTSPKTIISKEYPSSWKKGEEPFYPINDERNNSLYRQYLQLSSNEKNVYFGGRLGLYKYFDMDDTIENALDLINKLLNK